MSFSINDKIKKKHSARMAITIMTLSIKTLSKMTNIITGFFTILNINDTMHKWHTASMILSIKGH
jgi:hypothetical protein